MLEAHPQVDRQVAADAPVILHIERIVIRLLRAVGIQVETAAAGQPHEECRHVPAERLRGSTVRASTTIGFPHGGHTTKIKLAEARQALADGGEELDMVVNVSKVLSEDWQYVRDDIQAVVEETHAAGRKVKVIFENAYLKDAQKIRLCEICGELRADWVKTSTGYAPSGSTDTDLVLMRRHSPSHVQVKAAGGIRDLDGLLRVRALGVTRCGATQTAKMMNEARRRLGLTPIPVFEATMAD